MRVPIFPRQKFRGWPRSDGNLAPPVESCDLTDALLGRFPYDAHFAAYAPAGFRLKGTAIRCPAELDILQAKPRDALALIGGAAQMQLAIFDFDCKAAHATSTEAPLSWRLDFWQRALRALAKHPGAYGWDSRGGSRLVWRLPQPWPLSSPAHAEEWSCYYRAACLYFAESFGLQADRVTDWTRLFRLPGADRGAGFESQRLRVGSAERLGAFDLTGLSKDLVERARLRSAGAAIASTYTLRQGAPFNPLAAGVLPTLLHRRGALVEELQPGKWSVRCPGPGDAHGPNTSTVVWAWEDFGVLHCSHDRCHGWRSKGLEGSLSLFSEAELQAAASLCTGGLC